MATADPPNGPSLSSGTPQPNGPATPDSPSAPDSSTPPDSSTGRGSSEPAGVYVHIPFCARICPYCDFAVAVERSGERERLVDALKREIEQRAPTFRHGVDTIYFGGGTPSVLGIPELAAVIGALRDGLRVDPSCRVFLEANPEDVTAGAIGGWRDLGVTTLSLGVQAFDPEALRFLGRRHDADQAVTAIELARGSDFETVSVDLIYALPGQDLDGWMAELERACATGADHLSCYQLTVHPQTPFGRLAERGRLPELATTTQADLLVATHERLGDLGWDGYEVSNFARSPGNRSRHNLKYWRGAPYLGLGPSAHSFLPPVRSWNVADNREYLRRTERSEPLEEGSERLTTRQRLLESLMLGLRTSDGVDLAALERRFGLPLIARNESRVEQWCGAGWVQAADGRLQPTPRGLAVADHLAASFELP